MKTRMYTYTCEHPGSDVIITSDKPMNKPICPLCAAAMVSLEKQGDLSTRMVKNLKEAYVVADRLDAHSGYKSINDFPVRDLDAEAAEAGKELYDLAVGGVRDIRVNGKVVCTGNPGMPAHKEITEQTFSMENTITKYHGKLISEVDFYFESDEEIKHSYDPADYPEQVKALIEQESMKLGKDRFRVAAMWKHQTGTFKNSSEEQQER